MEMDSDMSTENQTEKQIPFDQMKAEDWCKLLCKKPQAKINIQNKLGRTPLDLAEMHKYQEIAKYLKDRGAVRGKSLNGKEKQ